MTPETEIIACPACKHLVRVPLDWLGTQVQCPECKAMFRAPVRADGKLTGAELLSRPATTADAPKARPRADVMLMLPAFGLLLCGVMGVLVNAWLLVLVADPVKGKEWAGKQVDTLRKMGIGAGEPPEKQADNDAQETERLLRQFQWILPASLVASGVVFLGGLSIVLRRNYRLAQVACVLAALNFAHLCCVPGAIAGLWGLLMLGSAEGREHFQK
ncbi:hypothetical protein J8F10_27800 [Gemmata sp. G18]|uniref:Zinc finger/thioredoxin putative domain-containing protein n=1 Tax=Gemmata palustris TaxID=2822762 RepID=A0ABS5BZB8_9BACT|nr:hypothetical protein [Gemmata palustris]MBP3959066.1 hypothetical protein [Gemmata palustris]